jgi:hypothetical protein
VLLAVCCCVSLCVQASKADAQGGVSSLGTDFWFGFMPDDVLQADNVLVFISTPTANHVNVEIYGGGNGAPVQTQTLDLPANTSQSILLDPAKAETRKTETPAYRAVHVTASNPLACSAMSQRSWTDEGFLALPTPTLGKEYYSANFFDDYIDVRLAGEFMIVAPFDSTHVTIVTKADTRVDSLGLIIGHRAGVPWTVTLRKAQTYLVQSVGRDRNVDITGSHITSDQPIGFLSGHQKCGIPNDDQSYKTMVAEMMLPLNLWGTEYFDLPMKSRPKCGDYLRLISGADGNDILVEGTGTHLFLNAGEWAERTFVLTPTSYASTNGKPCILMQYTYSIQTNDDPAMYNPFMITMTPREHFQNKMIFRTPSNLTANYINYVTVIGDPVSLESMQLNGKTRKTSGSDMVQTYPGTSPTMGARRILLGIGENAYVLNCLNGSSKFGAYLYGTNSSSDYGWPAALGLNLITKDSLPPRQLSFTETCGNYVVRVGETRTIRIDSVDDSRLSSIRLVTDTLDLRWNKASTNYIFTIDSNFRTGDTIVIFRLTVIDPTHNAYAAVVAVDRSGNDTVFEYKYFAPEWSISSLSGFPFDSVIVGSEVCKTLMFKNHDSVGSIHLSKLHLGNHTQHGTFRLSPSTLDTNLRPGESALVQLCYTAKDTGAANITIDTVFATTGCATFALAEIGKGVTPLIVTEDPNFGVVDTGKSLCRGAQVANVGTANLTITGVHISDTTNFSLDTSQKFPVVLAPGAIIQMNYCFHPTKLGLFRTQAAYTTTNPIPFLHAIKDTAILIGRTLQAGVSSTLEKSATIILHSSEPNPFRNTTHITYELSRPISTISLIIYDALGREVARLVDDQRLVTGQYSATFDASRLASGSYFCRISDGVITISQELILSR